MKKFALALLVLPVLAGCWKKEEPKKDVIETTSEATEGSEAMPKAHDETKLDKEMELIGKEMEIRENMPFDGDEEPK